MQKQSPSGATSAESALNAGSPPPESTAQEGSAGPPALGSGLALTAFLLVVLGSYYGALVRCFARVEINYNEGWNAYSALLARSHSLYPVAHGWTTVNYPFLSFFLIDHLARVFGDPLYVGRVLSLAGLLVSALAVYGIVRQLTPHRAPALFAAAYLLWFIPARVPDYVGMDDPQLLGQAVVLCGLFVYLKYGKANWGLLAVAFLFVLGGNVKHNLVAAPIAVFIDLLLRSRIRALLYALWGALFVGISIPVNQWAGGPGFLSQLLSPRDYALYKVGVALLYVALPFSVCAVWSATRLAHPRHRLAAFYFIVSFALGFAFFSGSGTAMNMLFDGFVAISILMGIFLESLWYSSLFGLRIGRQWKWAAPLLLWALVPLFSYPPIPNRALAEKKSRFNAELAFLKAQPGPALCESLLHCYFAGKPYVYDPFNSTALVRKGLLDPQPMIQRIGNREFGAIQTYLPVEKTSRPSDHFPDAMLNAIEKDYRVAMEDQDGVIYVPRQPASSSDAK